MKEVLEASVDEAAGGSLGIENLGNVLDELGQSTSTSLLINMRKVDALLTSHMAAALQNATNYAQHENLVVERLGQAATRRV